jgi:uncharacterized protein HemY
LWRAKTELQIGAYGAARDAVEKLLKRQPRDPALLLLREAAIQKLKEQASR